MPSPASDNYQAIRDQNRIPVAMGQSNADAVQTLPFIMDSVTGRLLVDVSTNVTTAVYNEVVSGSGTTWTLLHTPVSGTLLLYANGQRLMPTVDYSLVGTTITTVITWAAITLLADYFY